MIAPGRRDAGQLLHHAFEPLRARETADVGFPTARERRARSGGGATNVPLPTRECTRPRAASSSYACETVTSAQFEFARELAHRGKTVAGCEPLVFDRFDELIGELNVERTRVGGLEAKRRRRRAALPFVESIADAADARDFERRVDLDELLAQRGDVHVDHARRHARGVVPDVFEYLRARQQTALRLRPRNHNRRNSSAVSETLSPLFETRMEIAIELSRCRSAGRSDLRASARTSRGGAKTTRRARRVRCRKTAW